MESWFRDRLHQNELVLLSDSGFTNDELAIRFLEHFILYSDAGPSQPPKLLLMDNHGSHVTPEFINIATSNNVVPFTFPAHLTHCMQPCDVGIFQAMKHWHNKAIQHALEFLEFDYTIASFLRDLPEIRTKTLKKSTIKEAFNKAGMWPVNAQKVLKTMSKFMKETSPEPPALPTLPPQTPQTTHEFRAKWDSMQSKIYTQLSSPSQHRFNSINRGLQNLLDTNDITKVECEMLYTRVAEISRKKPINRRRIKKGGELTAQYANELIRVKEQERAQKWAKKESRARRISKNKQLKELNRKGVYFRKLERVRIRSQRLVVEGDIGAAALFIPIPDPETEAAKADIIANTEATIPEGLEAGDPETWFEPVEYEPFEPTFGGNLSQKFDWREANFIPLEEEESEYFSGEESIEDISM
jgi:hypothetical protein